MSEPIIRYKMFSLPVKQTDTSVIPKGLYCYKVVGMQDHPKYGRIPKYEKCPYWHLNPDAPEQANGFCSYLQLGDWMENGTFLLWDSCKECGINEAEE